MNKTSAELDWTKKKKKTRVENQWLVVFFTLFTYFFVLRVFLFIYRNTRRFERIYVIHIHTRARAHTYRSILHEKIFIARLLRVLIFYHRNYRVRILFFFPLYFLAYFYSSSYISYRSFYLVRSRIRAKTAGKITTPRREIMKWSLEFHKLPDRAGWPGISDPGPATDTG